MVHATIGLDLYLVRLRMTPWKFSAVFGVRQLEWCSLQCGEKNLTICQTILTQIMSVMYRGTDKGTKELFLKHEYIGFSDFTR